jgi:hypothetical protein
LNRCLFTWQWHFSIGLMNSLPLLSDRLLVPCLDDLAATLVLPSAVTAMLLLYNVIGPTGSLETAGYKQLSN